jgi:hypothetical protein
MQRAMAVSESKQEDIAGSLVSFASVKDEFNTFTSPVPNSRLEPPLVGQDSSEAGFWATRAKDCPWQKAYRPKNKPSEKIHALITLATQREPALRRYRNPAEFDDHVCLKKPNIEALLAQTIGISVPTDAHCEHCQRELGQFVSCVIVPSLADDMPECANCHRGGVGYRCSFFKAAKKLRADIETSSMTDISGKPSGALGDSAPAIHVPAYNEVAPQNSVDDQQNHLEELVQRHRKLIAAKAEVLGIIAIKQLAANRLDEEMEAVEAMIMEVQESKIENAQTAMVEKA